MGFQRPFKEVPEFSHIFWCIFCRIYVFAYGCKVRLHAYKKFVNVTALLKMRLLVKQLFSLKSRMPQQACQLNLFKHAPPLTIDKSKIFYNMLMNKNVEVEK